MKIGIFDPYLDTMSGGERYMLTLASCLAGNHEVSIFWDLEHEAAIIEAAMRKFAMKLEGVSFTASLFNHETSFLKRLQTSRKYDLIVVLSDGSIPILLCPLVLHFQTPVEWVNGNSLLTQVKLRKVQKILVNSQFTKELIDRKFHIKSTVLYPPVSLPKDEPHKKEHLILNVGRFGIRTAGSSYKKQDVLAKTFQKMVENGLKDWELVFIMGVAENDREKAETFIESLKKQPIRVLINPNLETVSQLYQKASLYWHAAGYGEDLEKHPDRAEHFGIATVEAMSYGGVPLVINAGGQPEIVRDGEDGFLWTTTDELIEKSLLLIQDTSLRKKLAEQAEKRARSFSREHFCEALKRNIV